MGSTACIKKSALAIDFICTVLGLILVAFGVYAICSYDMNEVAITAMYAYVAVGVTTLIVLLLGSTGAIKENVCCTITFIVVALILMIAQVAVVFLLTTQAQPVASNLANTLDAAWEDELNNPGAMSHYESWFDCCGRASPQDYIVNGVLPPPTCYKDHDNTTPSNLIMKGCRVEFENYWLDLLLVFDVLAWILIAVQLIRSIVSCLLCNSIRNDRRRSYF